MLHALDGTNYVLICACMYVCMYTVDVVPCQVVEDWMKDFESYQNAVDTEDKEEYMGSLNRSLSLAMEEFYK
jgi:hypothetical protein